MVLLKLIFISCAFYMLFFIIPAASMKEIHLIKRAGEDGQSFSQPQNVKKAKRPYHKYNTPEERKEGKRLSDLRYRKKYTNAGKEEAMQNLTGEELLKFLDSSKKIKEQRKILASEGRKNRKARGIIRTSNRRWNEQFSNSAIKQKQSELQGEELATFNEKVRKIKARRAAYDAKRYAQTKYDRSEKDKERRRMAKEARENFINPEMTDTQRKYSETDIRAANLAASSQIPIAFRPHKQSNTENNQPKMS